MLVHDPYKLISGPQLSTNSRVNNSYEEEMTHKREGSVGLLITKSNMGFPLKYDPCPQFLLYHSWESSIPDKLHEWRAIPPKFIPCGSSSLPPRTPSLLYPFDGHMRSAVFILRTCHRDQSMTQKQGKRERFPWAHRFRSSHPSWQGNQSSRAETTQMWCGRG